MLTQEGQEAAHECLLRSGLDDSIRTSTRTGVFSTDVAEQTVPDLGIAHSNSTSKETAKSSVDLDDQNKFTDIPTEFLEKVCSTLDWLLAFVPCGCDSCLLELSIA